MKYSDLTLDQIREAIPMLISNAKAAMAADAADLAFHLQDKAEDLWLEFVNRIQAEEPHASEADIRYYEGISLF